MGRKCQTTFSRTTGTAGDKILFHLQLRRFKSQILSSGKCKEFQIGAIRVILNEKMSKLKLKKNDIQLAMILQVEKSFIIFFVNVH